MYPVILLLPKDRSPHEAESNSQSPVPDLMLEYVQAPDSLVQGKRDLGRSPNGPQPVLKKENILTIPALQTSSAPAKMQAQYSNVQVSVGCSDTHTPIEMEAGGESCDGNVEALSSYHPDQKTDPSLTQTEKKLERPKLKATGPASRGHKFRISQSEPQIVDFTNSSSSELNDDADGIFDTPIPNIHHIQAQCSPLTPPSTYTTPSTWLGDDKLSPTKARPSRPGPKPLQDVKTTTENCFRGRATIHQPGEDQSKSHNLSADSCISTARSRSRSRSRSKESTTKVEKNPSQTSIKTKIEEETLNDHVIYSEDISNPTNVKIQPCPSNLRERLAAILIGIFGFDILDPIQQGIQQNAMQCVALTKTSNRCQRKWSHDVSAAQEYLHNLQKWPSLRRSVEELKALIELVFCTHNHRGKAIQKALDWLLKQGGVAIIQELVNDNHGSDTVLISDYEITILFNTKTPDVSQKCEKEAVVSSSPNEFEFSKGISVKPRQQRNGNPRSAKPWQPPETVNLSVSHSLIKEILQPLTARELNPGYMYIYGTTCEFGYKKIGVTENAVVKKRLRSSAAKCRIDAIPFYTEGDQPVLVKHVYRLEKLVHTELKEMRHQITNCSCGVKHKEWFQVKDEHAIEVIRRWTAWLETDPYEDCGGIWLLKGLFNNFELGPLSTPYVPPGEKPVPSRAPRRKNPAELLGRRRSSKRIAARAMPTKIN